MAKKRHHKRRIINADFLADISKKLFGKLVIATDHEEYADWICNAATKIFNSIETPHNQSIETRYKQKAKTKIHYFVMRNI